MIKTEEEAGFKGISATSLFYEVLSGLVMEKSICLLSINSTTSPDVTFSSLSLKMENKDRKNNTKLSTH